MAADAVNLIAPNGVKVSVAASRERELVGAGYRPAEPASKPPEKRAAAKKK